MIVLLLVACGPKVDVIKLGEEVVEEPEVEFIPPTTDIQEQFSETQYSQWQLIVFNVSEMKSHEFSVAHGITGGARVRQRAHLTRIDYKKPQSIVGGDIIDVAYFDTEKKRAVGFCRTNERTCEPYAGERIQLTYNQFYIQTPRDWVLKFGNVAPSEHIPEAEIISDRFTDKFVFKNPRVTTTLFIDTFSKLPIRVTEEGKEYKQTFEYDSIQLGTVSAKDVFH